MTAPADREFATLPRGWTRDRIILANFRAGLLDQTNPETGTKFTPDEIARATQVGSRWWIEADGIDMQAQLQQREGIYLSDQGRPERANSEFLLNMHGKTWGLEKLPPTGGSGSVTIGGTPGTVVNASTTIPDADAYQARDGTGKLYQVFASNPIGAGSTVVATIAAVDTGAATNLAAGAKLTWTKRDPGMNPEATVLTTFRGGTDLETDQDFLDRVMDSTKHKAGAGNDAHFRQWGRSASNAIEDAFIYPCALHAGSVVVAITQKRLATVGPLARIPDQVVMAAAIAYLTPPGSPVVPSRAFVLVVPVQSVPTYAYLRLALARGTDEGWADVLPFPTYHASCAVSARVSDVDWTLSAPNDATLPGQPALATLTGADCPRMMIWDEAATCFRVLSLSSIQDLGANLFRVQLSAPPGCTVAVTQRVCPYMSRHALVSAAVQTYFDELGPAELFDIDTDPRGNRCRRFPSQVDDRPYRAGDVIAVRVCEALGTSSADADLPIPMSPATPGYPASISDGPLMHTCGKIGVYAL